MSNQNENDDVDNNNNNDTDIQYKFERNWLWLIKMRVQKTGWLQYMPPLVLGNVCLALSSAMTVTFASSASCSTGNGSNSNSAVGAVDWLWFSQLVSKCLVGVSKVLFTIGIFDILTIKFNIRPSESLPQQTNNRRRRDDDDDSNKMMMDDIFEVMRIRHSCRSFQPRKMTTEDRNEILDVARKETVAASSSSSSIRFEYVPVPLRVWPTVNAQEFLVAIIAPSTTYDRYAIVDVGRRLQGVVLHATSMGLGTCWIGPGADHVSVVRALTTDRGCCYDHDTDHIICVCAVGYPSILVPFAIRLMNAITSTRRLPLDQLFFADPYFQTPLDVTQEPFTKFKGCYEAARWSPSSFNAQPTRCVGYPTGRFDFYATTNSRYYAPVAVGIWMRNWENGCKALGISGRFAILSEQERGVDDKSSSDEDTTTTRRLPELPRYDVSWITEWDNAGGTSTK